MDLKIGQMLVCNEVMAKKFPKTRTLGKAYPITYVAGDTITVENNSGGSGIYHKSDLNKYFTTQSHELWV